jgi:nucleotide-binding universal stress UspA family protein
MKVLLAVDGSPFTKKMLAYLATHDSWLTGVTQWTALTVQSDLPARAKAALGKEVVQSHFADEADKVLKPVVKFMARHGVEVQTLSKVGRAAQTIAKFAQSGGYDLLIMGSHGHSMLGTIVMGSVATQVIGRCKVPVLLIR